MPALVAGIHVFEPCAACLKLRGIEGVDGRPGHDVLIVGADCRWN